MNASRDTAVGDIWEWLSAIPDPEIPVISLTDLGIIRDVAWDDDTLVVTVTPTYSGCPATGIINLDIERVLRERGVSKVRIVQQLAPAWTTDWIKDAACEKLRDYGIAPPVAGVAAARIERLLAGPAPTVACPRCGSARTQMISQFGSTPCKAHMRCQDCLEPFDYFKCI